MQSVNFEIEIIIHDDASSDSSQGIIQDYYQRFPNLIRPILQTENQYSKGMRILPIAFAQAKGKYIALCEGDDYWTDPYKLQKQVDYLESHPDCSLCFHNAILHWENGEQPDSLFANVADRDYSGVEMISNWLSSTASIVFRSQFKDSYAQLMKDHPLIKIGDRPLVAHCSKYGTIHCIPDIMSVYTKHPGGYTLFADATKTYEHARTWEEIGIVFGKDFYEAVKHTFISFYLNALLRSIRTVNPKIFVLALYRGILLHPIQGLTMLSRIPQERRARLLRKD